MNLEEACDKLLKENPPKTKSLGHFITWAEIGRWGWFGRPANADRQMVKKEVHRIIEDRIGEALLSPAPYIREYAKWKLNEKS